LQIQTPPPYKKTIKEKIKNLESKKHRYFAYAQYDKAIKQERKQQTRLRKKKQILESNIVILVVFVLNKKDTLAKPE